MVNSLANKRFYLLYCTLFLHTFLHSKISSEMEYKEVDVPPCCETSQCPAPCNPPIKTVLIPISSAQNLYTQYHKPGYNVCDLTLFYRFQEASNNNDIAKSVFQYNPLLFVGEDVGDEPVRPYNGLIPEYFGLGKDTNTSFLLTPQIRNQIIDLQISFQAEHAWLQINVPVIKPQWSSNSKPITNNRSVGTLPLQGEAQTYIYNIGQTCSTLISKNDKVPPCSLTGKEAGYNVLPPLQSAEQTLRKNSPFIIISNNKAPNTDTDPDPYNGAYIISTLDASDFETTATNCGTGNPQPQSSLLTQNDQNKGSVDMGEAIYEKGFAGNATLDKTNWSLPIGEWDIRYEGMAYLAPTMEVIEGKQEVVEASLESVDDYELTGATTNVADSIDEEVNTLNITQPEVPSSETLTNALSGEYNFNDTLTRKYNNFNFNQDLPCSTWNASDIILWAGWDFCNTHQKHLGLYIHGVIPAGTIINENWNKYVFNPVVGNGNHFQLGLGITGHYLFCENRKYSYKCQVNGYVDHVFATKQFRVFDHNVDLPMSRYAVLKKLTYASSAVNPNPVGTADGFNDDYEFDSFQILGNVNTETLMINNNFRGEAIVDLIVQSDCFSMGVGYAFSGLSEEQIGCKLQPQYLSNALDTEGQTYYGYKGNSTISNLIVTNITTGQEIFNPKKKISYKDSPNTPPEPANYPVAAKFAKIGTDEALPNTIYIKSSGDVVEGGDGGAYSYAASTGGPTDGSEYVGTTSEDVFILPNIEKNRTGLMDTQILNRIFAHTEYTWNSSYDPKIGIFGSYGFSSMSYWTPEYWDAGLFISCSF